MQYVLEDFDFELPAQLIAQVPCKERTESRLLCLNKQNGHITHRIFRDIAEHLRPEDLLIFNDTRVIPARMFGTKASGGKLEILIERILDPQRFLAHLRSSKSLKSGQRFYLGEEVQGKVIEHHEDGLFECVLIDDISIGKVLEEMGHMPLPLYIQRQDEAFDKERYQTVYAKHPGSVAAPTAGLHFDHELLKNLKCDTDFVTLHVGAGTFQPIRTASIQEHKMHKEYFEVSARVCEKIIKTKQQGGRVIAVGTTTVRSLETAARDAKDLIQPYQGETDIFIYPGFKFKVIDALITNFHLPKSTLLMLVSTFAGYQFTMQAYQTAIQECYRFYSYGDAMFIGDL